MHMPDNGAFTSRQYVDIDKMRVAGGPGPLPTEAAEEGNSGDTRNSFTSSLGKLNDQDVQDA